MLKTLEYRMMSLRVEVWAHKVILAPPRFIDVPVWSQEHERPCMCVHVRDIHFVFVSTIFLLDFGTVPTVSYFFYHFITTQEIGNNNINDI
jgi:hypothetical protein